MRVEARQIEQLRGQVGGAINAGNDLRQRGLACRLVVRQAGDFSLHPDGSERGAQFVCGVGGKPALILNRCANAPEQGIERCQQRTHFTGLRGVIQSRQVARVAGGHFSRQPIQRRQATAYRDRQIQRQ